MSGQDEFRPSCGHCSPQYKDGLDNRRFIARNSEHENVMVIASVWEESVTGFRIAEIDDGERTGGKVIVSVCCNRCGFNSTSHELVFATKRYIYKYQKAFGTSNFIFMRALESIYRATMGRSDVCYEDYLGEDIEFCDNCGNPAEVCVCEATCDKCGQPVSECRCCEHCGEDSLYCSCECDD